MKRWLRIVAMVMVMVMLLSVLAACTTAGDNGDDDDDEGGKKEEIVDTSKMEGPEHWQYVQGKMLKDAVGAFTSTYGMLLNGDTSGKASGASMDVTVELGDAVMTILGQALSQSGMNFDLSFLSNIKLGMDVVIDGGKEQMDLVLGLGGKDVATLRMIMDMVGGMVFLGLPEFNDSYLGVSLDMAGMDMPDMDQLTGMIEQAMAVLPSEKVIQSLAEKYIDIALKSIKNVDKSSHKLTLGDLSQDCTKLVVTIRHEDALNLAINVLEALKEDGEIQKILSDVAKEFPELTGGADINEVFTSTIEGVLESLKYDLEEPEEGEIVLTTYTDSKNNIIGCSLATPESDAEDLYFTMVTQGDNFVFEANAMGQVSIEGNGTNKGGKLDGTFCVYVMNQEAVTFELKNFDTAKLDKGDLSGTVVISAPLLDDAMDPSMSQLLGDLKLSLTFDCSGNKANIQIKADTVLGTLATITLETKSTSGGSISIPNNYMDATNQNELMTWVSGIKFDKVLNKLQGVLPNELMTMLEQVLGQMGGAY